MFKNSQLIYIHIHVCMYTHTPTHTHIYIYILLLLLLSDLGTSTWVIVEELLLVETITLHIYIYI